MESSIYSADDQRKDTPTPSSPSDDDELDDLAPAPRTPAISRGRSGSLGGYAYRNNLLSLAASAESPTNHFSSAALESSHSNSIFQLNAFNGAALTVGVQIGAGIFSSPGVVLAEVANPGPALLVWAGSGFLAWTGAASFAELGAAIPLNGGPQSYLLYAFSPLVAFLFSWSSITVLKPGSAGAVALVFSEYMCRVLYHTAFTASPQESVAAIPKAVIKLVAILSIALVALLNILSTRTGTHATTALTIIKVVSLVGVMIIGIVQLALGRASQSLQSPLFQDAASSPGSYALALYSGLWAYSGWDQLCYVAGDLRNPTKNLPRVIHFSMGIVIALYIMANLSYFIVLPVDAISHSNTVALDFGKEVLGPVGGLIFALLVACSCLGNLNGDLFTCSRLIAEAGQEGFLPRVFAKYHSTRNTPIYAICLQSVLSSLLVLWGDFKSLIVFSSVCAYAWYLTIIGALLVLRIREPDLARPYKTWITTPISFACVALFLLCMPLASAPLEALAAFVFIVSGLPVYYVTQYHSHAGDWLRGMWGGGGGGKGQSTAGYQPTSQHEEEVPMAER